MSHNLHASTLPLIVAARHGQRSLAAGLHHQHDFLAKAGIDVDAIVGGGAGGDRADYTTRVTVQLLRYMATRPDFAAYRDALPVLGGDGTLATAVGKDSPARAKFHAKTGTLVWNNTMNGTALLNSKGWPATARRLRASMWCCAWSSTRCKSRKADDREHIGQVLGKICEAIYQQ